MILLASTSPQRHNILKSLGIDFRSIDSKFDESTLQKKLTNPVELVERLALGKLNKTIQNEDISEYNAIFAADTTVVFDDGIILGKPTSKDDAKKMLLKHSNNTHTVITAIAGYNTKTHLTKTITSKSLITFTTLSDSEIEKILKSNEWKGCAGSYRMQGLASLFIKRIEGSYTNIVGLPVHEFYRLCTNINIDILT